MMNLRLPALAICLLAASCTLLTNTADPIQCHSNGDCSGALSGRLCEKGYCVVPRENPIPVSSEGGAGCSTTALCTQANGGKASVCKQNGGTCTPWQTPDCPYIYGAWDDPHAIVVGAMMPFTVEQVDHTAVGVPYVDRVGKAMRLALEEITTAQPQGLLMGGTRRPLALLQCNTRLNPKAAPSIYEHLRNVGVEALLIEADEDLAPIAALLTEKKTAVACFDCVAPFPSGPLAWRITPPLVNEAPLAADRVKVLEAQLRLARGLPATTPIKVALMTEPGPGAIAFANAFTSVVSFNGKSAANNGASFLPIQVERALTDSARFGLHANEVLAFEPDIVVVALASDFPKYYLPLIDAVWDTAKKPKPYYVLNQMNDVLEPLAQAIGNDDDLRQRLSGTKFVTTKELKDNIDAFGLRFRQAYGKDHGNSFTGYDAFYAMAYAIAASSTASVQDGAHFSQGFESLVTGATIDFGPGGIGPALSMLISSSKINVRGSVATLDWNVSTRDLSSDAGMYCVERAGDGTLRLNEDAGPTWSSSTGTFGGTPYSCQ